MELIGRRDPVLRRHRPPAPARDVDADALGHQLLDGLSPQARRIGEAFLEEWGGAVVAVPELSAAAAEACLELLRLAPAERDRALRRRGARIRVDAWAPGAQPDDAGAETGSWLVRLVGSATRGRRGSPSRGRLTTAP